MVRAREAKQWAFQNAKGLWCSPLTPFDSRLEIDYEAIRYNVNHIVEQIGVEGMGYGHSEPWCLSHDERKSSAKAFVEAVDGRVFTYIHSHDHSAPETVTLTNHAAQIGADLVMIEPPYEHAKSEEMIYQFYKYVTDRTDIGIILLNTPHSGRIMSPELISRIADLDAVCALKDGIQDFSLHTQIYEKAHDRIVVSAPGFRNAIRCIQMLDQQVQLGTSEVFLMQARDWHPLREIVNFAKAGQFDKAQSIHDAMSPTRTVFEEMLQVLFSEFPEHPITMQKVWMDAIGMRGGPVRLPMRSATEIEREALTRRVIDGLAKAKAATRAVATVG